MASSRELLNDDRIARALDAVAPHLDEITGGVGAAAITEFGVDVSRLHWDLTSISLYGAYPEARGVPGAAVGASEGPRPDLKQIQTGLAVSGDGGIPVFHRAYDGGAAEVAQVAGAMTALKQIAGPRPFLLVGDSKLISYTNAAAMNARGVGFVAPLAAPGSRPGCSPRCRRGRHGGGLYRRAGRRQARRRPRQLPGAGRRRDGPARPAQGRPAGAPAPDPGVLLSERRRRGHSPRAQTGQGRRGPGPAGAHRRDPVSPHPDAVAARVQAIAAQRRVRAYLRTAITRDAAGKPSCPGTSTRPRSTPRPPPTAGTPADQPGPDQAGPAEVFRRYKGQHAVERRYGEFKGPLAVAPLFLKTNRRITALITVICLALLIFCLIERQVRKALPPHGEMMTGLPGYRPPRQTHRPPSSRPSPPAPDPRPRRQPRQIPKPAGSRPGSGPLDESARERKGSLAGRRGAGVCPTWIPDGDFASA